MIREMGPDLASKSKEPDTVVHREVELAGSQSRVNLNGTLDLGLHTLTALKVGASSVSPCL